MQNRCSTNLKAPNFPKNTDLMKCLHQLQRTYLNIESSYRDKLYSIMKRCYAVGLAFEDRPEEFERLKNDRYWSKASRKLPTPKGKPDDVMRWTVFFMTQPEGNARDQVARWAKVLCHFRDVGLPVKSVVPRLKGGGGIKGTIEDILERNSGAGGAKQAGRPGNPLSEGALDEQDDDGRRLGRSPGDSDTELDVQHEKARHAKAVPARRPKTSRRMLEVATRSRAQELRGLTPGRIVIYADVTEGRGDWKDIKATQIKNL